MLWTRHSTWLSQVGAGRALEVYLVLPPCRACARVRVRACILLSLRPTFPVALNHSMLSCHLCHSRPYRSSAEEPATFSYSNQVEGGLFQTDRQFTGQAIPCAPDRALLWRMWVSWLSCWNPTQSVLLSSKCWFIPFQRGCRKMFRGIGPPLPPKSPSVLYSVRYNPSVLGFAFGLYHMARTTSHLWFSFMPSQYRVIFTSVQLSKFLVTGHSRRAITQ